MSISVESIEEGRILYITVIDPITADQLTELLTTTKTYLDNASSTVHFLADISQFKRAPKGLELRHMHSFNHPRRGDYAIVGANKIIRALAEHTLKMFRYSRFAFFDTLEEAAEYLYERVEAAQQ
jgi:hypothetical protein